MNWYLDDPYSIILEKQKTINKSLPHPEGWKTSLAIMPNLGKTNLLQSNQENLAHAFATSGNTIQLFYQCQFNCMLNSIAAHD